MSKKAFLFGANTHGLKYAEQDVLNVKTILESFDYSIIIPEIKRTSIINNFDEFIDNADKSDFILFYFSGHGFLNRGELHLVINEGNLEKRKNAIGIKFFIDGLKFCKATEKLLVIDSCNAGAATEDLLLEQSERYRILTASEKLEKTKEIESLNGSFLTHHFISALKEIRNHGSSQNCVKINNLYSSIVKKAKEYNYINNFTIPIPNLLGNQKNDFEIVSSLQIKKTQAEKLTINDKKVIFEKVLEDNEKLFDFNIIQLENLYDTNVKLYNQIFSAFFLKLCKIPHLKEKQPKILFNRIVALEYIEDLDYLIISRIRNDDNFTFSERSVIVSALTVSLLSKLNETKLNLLIDFLIDFESGVWERALIGLILSIKNRDKLINSYPKILKRLHSLQFIPELSNGLAIISHILYFENYSIKKQIENKGIDIFIEPIFKFYSVLSKKTGSDFLTREDVRDLIEHVASNEDNLFGIDYYNKFDFFKEPYNWFLPFPEKSELVENILKKPEINIDINNFQKLIYENRLLNDIDKYYLCLNIKELEKEDFLFLQFFNSLDKIKEYGINYSLPFPPKLYFSFQFKIREIYRYANTFSKVKLQDVFQKQIDIYNSELLNIVTKEWQKYKIYGDVAKSEGLHIEAIKNYLQAYEINSEDTEVLIRLSESLYSSNYFNEALFFFKKLNISIPNNIDIMYKLACCHSHIGEFKIGAQIFEHILLKSPNNVAVLINLALFYSNNKKYYKAINYLKKVEKQYPNDYFILNKLSDFYGKVSNKNLQLDYKLKSIQYKKE